MIRAAELGGILDQILDRLSGFLEYEAEIKGKIKSAMMYPVLVLCFSRSCSSRSSRSCCRSSKRSFRA
jgi:type IV pilus assembly protein PilC